MISQDVDAQYFERCQSREDGFVLHPGSNDKHVVEPLKENEPPGYNKAAIMALAGLGIMVNCAAGIDILADFDVDIKQHVGGRWGLSAFSVLGALSLLAGSLDLQMKNMVKPSATLVAGAKFTNSLALLCIAQAIVYAAKMDRGFVTGLLDCGISFVSGAVVLGLAYNNAKNVSEERSAARSKMRI